MPDRYVLQGHVGVNALKLGVLQFEFLHTLEFGLRRPALQLSYVAWLKPHVLRTCATGSRTSTPLTIAQPPMCPGLHRTIPHVEGTYRGYTTPKWSGNPRRWAVFDSPGATRFRGGMPLRNQCNSQTPSVRAC